MKKLPEAKILLLQLSLLTSPLLLYFLVPKCLGPNEFGRYVRVLANPMLLLSVTEILLSSAAVKCQKDSQLLKKTTRTAFGLSISLTILSWLAGCDLKNTLLAGFFQISTLTTAFCAGPLLRRNQLEPYVAAKVLYTLGLACGLPFCKTAEQAMLTLCVAHFSGSAILGVYQAYSKSRNESHQCNEPTTMELVQSGLLIWMLNLPFTASVSLATLTLDNSSLASFRITNSAVTAAFMAFPPVQLLWADSSAKQVKGRFSSHVSLVITVSILGAVITPIFTERYLGFKTDLWMDVVIFSAIPVYLAAQRASAIYQKEAHSDSLSVVSFLICLALSAIVGLVTKIYLAPCVFPCFYLVGLAIVRNYSPGKTSMESSPTAGFLHSANTGD